MEISGKVQQVFFRHTAKKMAESLGLTGCIRNTDHGTVQCEVQGVLILVEQFIAFAVRGPRLAEVKRITMEYIEVVPDEKEFVIK